jgi:hypothetical protein
MSGGNAELDAKGLAVALDQLPSLLSFTVISEKMI